VARKIDEMHAFAALMLSTEIGEDVDVVHAKAIRDRAARIDGFVKAMIDGNPVPGRLRIPNTAGDISTEIDLRAQQFMGRQQCHEHVQHVPKRPVVQSGHRFMGRQ